MESETGTSPECGSGALCSIAIDCGSGGTRVWQWSPTRDPVRLPWPKGGKAPVLSSSLSSATARQDFASALVQLAQGGQFVFVGATAGLRHALEVGEVSEADLAAFRQLLPAQCALRIIPPLEEARYELKALRVKIACASFSMISMGGKSMQLGAEGSLFSLPFAMHLGYGELRRSKSPWPLTVKAVGDLYRLRCEEEFERQQPPVIEGKVACITDVLDVAKALQFVDMELSAKELLDVLDACIDGYIEKEEPSSLTTSDFSLLARSLLVRAVVVHFFSQECTFLSRSDWNLNWTFGYFLEANTGVIPKSPGYG